MISHHGHGRGLEGAQLVLEVEGTAGLGALGKKAQLQDSQVSFPYPQAFREELEAEQ